VYIHVIFDVYFENYLACSRRCIIISIDGTSYKVEEKFNWLSFEITFYDVRVYYLIYT